MAPIAPAPRTPGGLTKVPQVVLLFWVVKIVSTTVGASAVHVLSDDVGLGLTVTSAIMAALFVAILAVQLRVERYVPAIYWLTVVLASIVGALACDNLVSTLGVSRWSTTGIFGLGLAATLIVWSRVEHSLSIDTIVTSRREAFYWLAILITFALGTSVGDLVSGRLALSHLTAATIFAAFIALVAVAYSRGGLDAVLAFWTAYVLTRPFGASVGNLLSAGASRGGLGLGSTTTSVIFLVVVLAAVGWFTVQERRDRAAGALDPLHQRHPV